MSTSERLVAAVGRADITPPAGIELIGFAGRGPSTGIHDPLTATALVLGCGETRAAIVACDLIDMDDDHVDAVTEMIHARSGIPRENVLFCCSHTHYGPSLTVEAGDAKAYRAHLNYVLAGLVGEVASRMVPVRIGVGKGACDVNVNRRERQPNGTIRLGVNPDGYTDREVILVRVEEDSGRPMAAVVSYACHGVCLSHAWRMVSSDFVGPMRQVIESVTGATSLYLQGATGNMNPKLKGNDYANARSTGVKLAGEAIKLWESITVEEACGLAASLERAALPAFRLLSKENAAATWRKDQQELEQKRSQGAVPSMIHWIERRVQRAEAALRSWETGEAPPTLADRIHAIRFGPAALVSSAGEVFAEIGVEVKSRSPLPNTLFAGYTNGDIGYVPIPAAYSEGGYEVERACRVDPEAGGMIIAACLQALRRLVH